MERDYLGNLLVEGGSNMKAHLEEMWWKVVD
jgi:hypothetical protein